MSSTILSVTTFSCKQEVAFTIDTTQDMKAIKQKDAFLYYSIPSVRSTALRMQEVKSSYPKTVSRSRTSSETKQDRKMSVLNQKKETVTRCTRLSVECYPDMLDDDLFDCTEDDFGDLDDPLDQFLERLASESCQVLCLAPHLGTI